MGRPAVDEATLKGEDHVQASTEFPQSKELSSAEHWHHMSMQLLRPELQDSAGRFHMPTLNAFGQAFRYITSGTNVSSTSVASIMIVVL